MNTPVTPDLPRLAALVRLHILSMSTQAGSGHATSSLSAADLMTCLFFSGTFKFDLDNPRHVNNDRIIFSKGHATPLLYALWAAAGKLTTEELLTYRKFNSPLEGHPSIAFPYVEAPTGSLGQGLSIGVGMALNARYLDDLTYRTYVLLGDSEMAEGSVWEALEIGALYKLHNLIGILDVNRLGQRGETMYGWDLDAYQKKIIAFGWKTIVLDGHDFPQIMAAFTEALQVREQPIMLIAKTVKGKGVSFIEDKNGWHGKALTKEEFDRVKQELGTIDMSRRGSLALPQDMRPTEAVVGTSGALAYAPAIPVATRRAFGNALVRIYPRFPNLVSLDGEVGNSTYADIFAKAFPARFFEMYIAEQNMVGVALGLACRGKIPFVSTFAAFLSRAFDQIRMSAYAEANIKFVGSHAGVSIGEDGPSQMGLEDIALFRAVFNSVVLYPADAIATEKLVEEAAVHKGIVYLRTTRSETPILYKPDDAFPIGGSKLLHSSPDDRVTIVAAGITVQAALRAHGLLTAQGISVRVMDCYSIKPLDQIALNLAAAATPAIITVEDHYPQGGLGEAVQSVLSEHPVPVYRLAVTKKPKSGKSQELLDYEEIGADAIVALVKKITHA